MNVTVIGCGNAFSHYNYNQSFMLEENGKRLLVDCGTRVPLALREHDIDIKSLDAIYISHAHGDHCGGLEEIAFSRYDWGKRPRHYKEGNYAPKLIANKILMAELWDYTLKGGLDSMEGFDSTLETFFEVCPVEPNKPFYWEGWKFDLVQQVHIMTGSVIKNTFGLFISHATTPDKFKKIFITTDCQYFQPKQVRVFYQEADIIFNDAEFVGVNTLDKKFVFGSGVHANFAELAGWPSANAMVLDPVIKGKIYLSHYQDFVLRHIPKKQKDFLLNIINLAELCADEYTAKKLVTECNNFVEFNPTDGFGNPCDWEKLTLECGFAGILHVGQVFTMNKGE